MDRRALDHALEGGGRHGLGPFDIGDQGGQVVVDEIDQRLAQFVQIDRAGLHHAGRVGFVDQRQQQMLQRCEFMAARIGKGQGAVDGLLECVRKRWHVLVLLFLRVGGGIVAPHQPWPHTFKVRFSLPTFKFFFCPDAVSFGLCAKCDHFRAGRDHAGNAFRTCPFGRGFRRKPRHRRHRTGRRRPSSAAVRRAGRGSSQVLRTARGHGGRALRRVRSATSLAREISAGIVGFKGQREADVRGGVFMARADQCFGRQGGQLRQAVPTSAAAVPSNRRPQPPAIRLSPVKTMADVGEVKGDVADGVAGHVDDTCRSRRRW